MRINFVKIEILEVKTGVQVSENINHFHIYSIGDVSDANGYKLSPKYRKMIIFNFTKIEILEVKMGVQVSKNINHFHIALAMPPMQMDINYPLPPMQMDINYPINMGKISDGKNAPGKILPRVNFPLRK